MVDAVRSAADDAGCTALLAQVGCIAIPQGMWSYGDPARLVADEIGSPQAKTVRAEFGVLQQTLISNACESIVRGEIDVAVVAGGEAKYRQLIASINGVEAGERTQRDAVADIVIKPASEIWLEAEAAAGLGMPVGFYAIYASALRAHNGWNMAQDREKVAALYQRFSEIAADNPQAWRRQRISAERFLQIDDKNPMLAFPYSKLHNTSWNVDQAAGLILTSAAKAQALGIPQQRWVFPLAAAESNHMVALSQRKNLHQLPGARICAESVLSAHDLLPDDIDYWDLYSCFPVAVQLYASAAKIPADRDYTVTGGMPFAGGPLNNYVLQSAVKMAQLLRGKKPAYGMLSSVSGMLTKQAFSLWSGQPGQRPYRAVDLSAEVESETAVMQVIDGYCGEGVIAGCTVLFQSGRPDRAVAVIDIDEHTRCIAHHENPQWMQHMMEEECVGCRVAVSEGVFSLLL